MVSDQPIEQELSTKQGLITLLRLSAIALAVSYLTLLMVKPTTSQMMSEGFGLLITMALFLGIYRRDNFSRQVVIFFSMPGSIFFAGWLASVIGRGIAKPESASFSLTVLHVGFQTAAWVAQIALAFYLLKPDTRALFVSTRRSPSRQNTINTVTVVVSVISAGIISLGILIGLLRIVGAAHPKPMQMVGSPHSLPQASQNRPLIENQPSWVMDSIAKAVGGKEAPIVGVWLSNQRSKGGIGEIFGFKSYGKVMLTNGVSLDGAMETYPDKLILRTADPSEKPIEYIYSFKESQSLN